MALYISEFDILYILSNFFSNLQLVSWSSETGGATLAATGTVQFDRGGHALQSYIFHIYMSYWGNFMMLTATWHMLTMTIKVYYVLFRPSGLVWEISRYIFWLQHRRLGMYLSVF